MFVFDKRGRLGLPHTLLAVVQGCTAAEDLAAACYLLCAAHTGHTTNGENACAAVGSPSLGCRTAADWALTCLLLRGVLAAASSPCCCGCCCHVGMKK